MAAGDMGLAAMPLVMPIWHLVRHVGDGVVGRGRPMRGVPSWVNQTERVNSACRQPSLAQRGLKNVLTFGGRCLPCAISSSRDQITLTGRLELTRDLGRLARHRL